MPSGVDFPVKGRDVVVEISTGVRGRGNGGERELYIAVDLLTVLLLHGSALAQFSSCKHHFLVINILEFGVNVIQNAPPLYTAISARWLLGVACF